MSFLIQKINQLNAIRTSENQAKTERKLTATKRDLAYKNAAFERDRERIIHSAAIRRLQQKTQVFPLERNSVVRTRLTHSMEVQQVGRLIVQRFFRQLQEKNAVPIAYETQHAMESLVEMACLAHDIGNPPFGHFGEAAINHWFVNYFNQNSLSEMTHSKNETLIQSMTCDLTHFEGNAQGIRLVHSLLKLNLTYSQIGAMLKYTRAASEPISKTYPYLTKKPGFYLSEQPLIDSLQRELEIKPYCRYFLSYIMEAADDISYCIADLEDAVEKNILDVPNLCDRLEKNQPTNRLFGKVIAPAYQIFKAEAHSDPVFATTHFFMHLREKTLEYLVPYAVKRLLANEEKIANGSFDEALLEKGKSAEFELLKSFKSVAREHVFNHHLVESMMLQGFKVITGLLEVYAPLLKMNAEDFILLLQNKIPLSEAFLIERLLIHRLSAKYCAVYLEKVIMLPKNDPESAAWEFYYRVRLIQDYISGMTDHFAYDEYRKMMAIA